MIYQFNNAILFLGASFYMGTGWSTWIFQFPVIPKLTTADYYNHFIPQIAYATDFFTFLVSLMVLTGLIMIIGEWHTRFRWVPIVMVIAVIGATCLTLFVIFPVNAILRAGVTDQQQLMEILNKWVFLTKIRVAIWSVEWLSMMYYFFHKAVLAGDRR
jgi:hypothetical protein